VDASAASLSLWLEAGRHPGGIDLKKFNHLEDFFDGNKNKTLDRIRAALAPILHAPPQQLLTPILKLPALTMDEDSFKFLQSVPARLLQGNGTVYSNKKNIVTVTKPVLSVPHSLTTLPGLALCSLVYADLTLHKGVATGVFLAALPQLQPSLRRLRLKLRTTWVTPEVAGLSTLSGLTSLDLYLSEVHVLPPLALPALERLCIGTAGTCSMRIGQSLQGGWNLPRLRYCTSGPLCPPPRTCPRPHPPSASSNVHSTGGPMLFRSCLPRSAESCYLLRSLSRPTFQFLSLAWAVSSPTGSSAGPTPRRSPPCRSSRTSPSSTS
jgi:hypothetical protein